MNAALPQSDAEGGENALSVFPGGKDVPESAASTATAKCIRARRTRSFRIRAPDKRGELVYRDLDGDGLDDLVHAISDWSNYGAVGPKCAVAYDANGVWANSQLEAYLYYFHTVSGTGESVKFDRPVKILAEGSTKLFLEGPWGVSRVMFHDWDGDGDTDFICGEFVDSFWYFENTAGKGNAPKFAKGRKALFTDGTPMTVDLCMYDPRGRLERRRLMDTHRRWRRTDASATTRTPAVQGRLPLSLSAGISGRRRNSSLAAFDSVRRRLGRRRRLGLHLRQFRGLRRLHREPLRPRRAKPKWAEPKLMTVKGKPIRTMAGPNGSPQGPARGEVGIPGVSVGD